MNRRLRVVPDPIIFLVPARSSPAFFLTIALFRLASHHFRRRTFRHAQGCSRDLQSDATPQASHDVQRDFGQGHPSNMQEVHGQRMFSSLLSMFAVLTVTLQPLEIFVDDETKLTLHGLQQHYVKLDEVGKNRKLNELLDTLEFNQASC